MTGAELRAALEELGLSQAEFAEFIDAHKITITNWCRGAKPVPLRIQRLVDALLTVDRISVGKSETITAAKD